VKLLAGARGIHSKHLPSNRKSRRFCMQWLNPQNWL